MYNTHTCTRENTTSLIQNREKGFLQKTSATSVRNNMPRVHTASVRLVVWLLRPADRAPYPGHGGCRPPVGSTLPRDARLSLHTTPARALLLNDVRVTSLTAGAVLHQRTAGRWSPCVIVGKDPRVPLPGTRCSRGKNNSATEVAVRSGWLVRLGVVDRPINFRGEIK